MRSWACRFSTVVFFWFKTCVFCLLAQARHNEIATLRTEVERLQAVNECGMVLRCVAHSVLQCTCVPQDVLHYQDKYNELRSQTSRLRREEISAADLREFQKLQAASRNTVPVNQVYRLAAFAGRTQCEFSDVSGVRVTNFLFFLGLPAQF